MATSRPPGTAERAWQSWGLRVLVALALLAALYLLPVWTPLERLEYDLLLAQNTGALFDNVASIAPVVLNAQTTLNTYEETPVFGQGHIAQASVSVNHLLGPRWSVLGSYIHTNSRNTGEGLEGHQLPGFARHVALLQTTWRHQGRSFSLLRMTWRGARYADEANTLLRPPGWSLALAHSWESQDRRWSLTGTVQTGLRTGERPTLWALVRYRD